VVLVHLFTLDAADEAAFLQVWRDDAACMKRQNGVMSTQLHRADSVTYLNYAVWETNADLRVAFTHAKFQATLSGYPSSTVASPHLFQKVAVAGICAG